MIPVWRESDVSGGKREEEEVQGGRGTQKKTLFVDLFERNLVLM